MVIPSVVLPSQAPFGGDLTTSVPIVPTWPEGPDVVLTRFSTTLGPGVGRRRVTYWEYSRSRYIPYHPRGILLPRRAPAAGSRSPPHSLSRVAHRPALTRLSHALADTIEVEVGYALVKTRASRSSSRTR